MLCEPDGEGHDEGCSPDGQRVRSLSGRKSLDPSTQSKGLRHARLPPIMIELELPLIYGASAKRSRNEEGGRELLDFTIEEEEGGSELVDFFMRWLPRRTARCGRRSRRLCTSGRSRRSTAETTVLAEVHTQSVLKEVAIKTRTSNYSTYNTREFAATQMQVLKSRDLTERVQNRLKLTENPKWKAGLDLPANAKPSELMEQTLYQLKSGFGISRERHARVIRLSYDHNDPLLTAEIVHAFAEEYVGKSSSQRTTSQKRAHLWLQTEEERLRSGAIGRARSTPSSAASCCQRTRKTAVPCVGRASPDSSRRPTDSTS